MRTTLNTIKTKIKTTLIIIPIVIALTAGFYALTGNAVLKLSKNKMVSKSESYANYMNTWTTRILNELNIYKTALDKEGAINKHSISVLSTSYGPHNEYPYGLYWGDESANFFDSSGWDPGPEYIPASRNWYVEGLTHSTFQFGEPYMDVRANRPCVSATVALNYGGKKSVLAADVYFDYADELVDRLAAQEVENAFFVSSKNRMIIADSDEKQNGTVLDKNSASSLYREAGRLLDEKHTGLTRLKDDEPYYINIEKIEGVDWYFVTCMKEKSMIQSIYSVNIFILIVGAVGCLILIYLTNRASKKLCAADKESKTDPLTGISNRDGFISSVTPALKNLPEQCALLMLDIDNFKAVNDNFDHPIGDEFLRSFAQLLCEYFNRSGEICARIGGDEFAVFVGRKISSDDITSMLSIFIERFHAKYDELYPNQNLSVSIGVAFVGSDDNSLEKVYADADKALYEAKNNGKNRYVIATDREA